MAFSFCSWVRSSLFSLSPRTSPRTPGAYSVQEGQAGMGHLHRKPAQGGSLFPLLSGLPPCGGAEPHTREQLSHCREQRLAAGLLLSGPKFSGCRRALAAGAAPTQVLGPRKPGHSVAHGSSFPKHTHFTGQSGQEGFQWQWKIYIMTKSPAYITV